MTITAATHIVAETDRLVLRHWQESDYEPFASLNADPVVMEFFPELRTREQSDYLIELFTLQFKDTGFGFWAVDRKDTDEFIGFVGLNSFNLDLPFCPCVETGWRLAHTHWGNGFATEAAYKSIALGFTRWNLPEIYAFTTLNNSRSQAVMRKIGMQDTGNSFLHPRVPAESGLQEHCLYRITKDAWLNSQRHH